MAKRYRGKTLRKLPSKGRGECPICGKTRIKLLYSHKTDTNQMIQVCKNCWNK
jgi:transcription elongation factor Elf1